MSALIDKATSEHIESLEIDNVALHSENQYLADELEKTQGELRAAKGQIKILLQERDYEAA